MNGAKGASPFLIGWILLTNQLNFSENKETQGTKIKLPGSLLDTAWKVKLTFFFKSLDGIEVRKKRVTVVIISLLTQQKKNIISQFLMWNKEYYSVVSVISA